MNKLIILFGISFSTLSNYSQPANSAQTATPPLVVVSDEARLIAVNKTMKEFVAELHASNIVGARKSLAFTISEGATDEHLVSLAKNIKRNDELIVFNKKMEYQASGTGPVLVEYKYKSETEAPEIFTVTFDEFNKITGFNSSKPNEYKK